MSDTVTSFADAHDKKHGPAAAHVWVDGVKWFEFACNFADDASQFGFTIWATDPADAERRLKLLRQTATVAGQVYHQIPG